MTTFTAYLMSMMLAFQLILSLSILIILHEFGHYIPARIFKIRVEKFYLFFDPWFSLIKKKVKDTEWGIGWLPFGGYVKIAGMIDESMDTEQMKQEPKPWEFRSKPAWQRLIVMTGGVIVNFILGILLYALTFAIWGEKVVPVENVKYGIHANEVMKNAGLQDGDKIIALNGERPKSFMAINSALLSDDIHTITVTRNGQNIDVKMPAGLGQQIVDNGTKSMPVAMRLPCVVDSVATGSNAAAAGLLKHDSIIAFNGVPTIFYQDVVANIKENKGKNNIPVQVKRNGTLVELAVNVTEDGTIGFFPKADVEQFGVEQINYSFFEAIPAGWNTAIETIGSYAGNLKYLFSKSGASQVGGFGTFAKLFPEEWNWAAFLRITAFISLILAFMNILPIPALDGGHVIFLLWEMITGKAVSQKILEKTQMVGFFLLLTLMLWGNIMDIVRAIFG
ncbi:MAG: metalloprotease RseP [Bacteroidota bacterium]|jgi:regulator of sigma E protease